MNVGILTIGNELTSGRTQDANASFIARSLHRRGWQIAAIMSVGDDDDAIRGGIDYLLSVADSLIVTGGLGPTADDITTAAVARTFGLELETDESVLRHIKEIMTTRNRPWRSNNAKQALFPAGAGRIINTVGTAWGFYLRKEDKIIAVMPGVPTEAKKMLAEGLIPILCKEFSDDIHVLTRTIKLSGISESTVDQALAGVAFSDIGVSIGFYPRFPELELLLTARDISRERAANKIARAEDEIVRKFSEHIFAYDHDTLEGVVAALLIERKATLALAESCTGGLIADRLTNVPGSSAFFERGLVTYSDASKEELLMVPPGVIRQHGAVSKETAVLMAEGVRKLAKTDLGLSTTGIAGPGGGTEEKPVGTVYIAVADRKRTYCRHFSFPFERRQNKVLTSQWALMILKKYLTDGLDCER
jgi:nicotinamide-nucleotide amidase